MSTPPAPVGFTAGWYADPTGRFEYRYHNGQRWTADVAMHGRRFLDDPGRHGSTQWGQQAPVPPQGPRRGFAITAFVVGLASVLTAWMPFVVVLAAVGAIVAFVFGVLGLRAASAQQGAGRALASVGLVTAVVALGLCAVGVILTRVVLREFDEFTNPGRFELRPGACRSDGGRLSFEGTIRNLDDRERDYTIHVTFVADGVVDDAVVGVLGVRPGATASWEAIDFGTGTPTCTVTDVTGPFPFGIDVDR